MNRIYLKSLAVCLALSFVLLPVLGLRAEAAPGADKVNINTASQADLEKLPRIGPKVAARILDYRKEHGPFKRVEDLMKVKGIGDTLFAGIRDLITVGPEAQTK
jgi:competence protein ComEA